MVKDAHINEQFRDKALRYTKGETVFLLDGMKDFRDARMECWQAIEGVRGDIKCSVMTMLWGNDNGSVIVSNGDDIRRLGDLDNGMLLPTLEEVQIGAGFNVSKKPLHVVLAVNSPVFDDLEKLEKCFKLLVQEPGVSVDVLLGPEADRRLGKLLKELQASDALRNRPETPLNLTPMSKLEGTGIVLVDVINARLSYDADEPKRTADAMLQGATEKVTLMHRLSLKGNSKE